MLLAKKKKKKVSCATWNNLLNPLMLAEPDLLKSKIILIRFHCHAVWRKKTGHHLIAFVQSFGLWIYLDVNKTKLMTALYPGVIGAIECLKWNLAWRKQIFAEKCEMGVIPPSFILVSSIWLLKGWICLLLYDMRHTHKFIILLIRAIYIVMYFYFFS